MLGIGSSWGIARWQAREKAYARLRLLMLDLGRKLYRDQAMPIEVIEPVYLEVLDSIWEAHRFTVLPGNKSRALQLGYKLLGHNTKSRHRHCHAYSNQAETSRAIEEVLAFVGCPYDYRFGPEDDRPER